MNGAQNVNLPDREKHGSLVLAGLILVFGVVLHVLLAVRPGGVIDTMRLPDTDAYTRLLRIAHLHATWDWHGTLLPGLNAPEGLSLHWTRPLDVLILLPALAAEAAGAEFRAALFWSGAALPPLLHLAGVVAAAWAVRPVWPGRLRWVAALALLCNPVILFAYGALGQADHHVLVLLCAVLALGAAIRAILAPHAARPAIGAGGALAAGLWSSPETLLIAAPVLAGFGAAWWLRAERAIAVQAARVAAAMLGGIVLALAVERAPGDWLSGEYDRLSAQHALIALLATAAFAALAAIPGRLGPVLRLALALVVAAAAAGALLACYPGALRASEAAADPGVARLFLPHVAEMQPLRATFSGAHDLLLYAGGGVALLGLPALWRSPRWPAALLLGLALATTLAATIAHRRFAIDLAAVTALAAPGLVALALARPRGGRVMGLGVAFPLALAAPLAGLAFPPADAARRAAAACDWAGLAGWLESAPLSRDTLILTDSWRATPELAWRTPYRFVVSPYHRAAGGFADTHAVLAATDDAQARAILARRGASHVLLCTAHRPPWLAAAEPAALDARLRADTPPGWLVPEPLPAGLPGFRLLRVVP
jgi:hypothetical protein